MLQKTAYILSLSLLCCSLNATILTSKLLHTIDGKSFGIHEGLLHYMLAVRGQTVNMLHGVNKDKKREGLYIFDKQDYTIDRLRDMETQHLITDKTWINQVKEKFTIQIRPFLELGRAFKPQMLIFIAESLRLHKRNHGGNVLLKWAETDDHNDMAAFNEYITTFQGLHDFLYDLLNFLDDLISSCPKAQQQYIDKLKTEKEKKTFAQRFKQLYEHQKHKISKHH